ncbi:MAG: DUF6489 family protein [Dermatophilaceae bacterium]
MKINVGVDCTPQEMRAFFGLPDLEPMQTAVMDELQRQMMSSINQLSPTTMMKDWFGPMNSALTNVFLGAFTPGAAGSRRRGHAGGTDDTPDEDAAATDHDDQGSRGSARRGSSVDSGPE